MNLRDDIAKLANRHVGELLTRAIEMLVYLDRGFLQNAVSLLRTASQQKVRSAGDPLLAIVGVKRQTE